MIFGLCYNQIMKIKKFLLLCLIFPCISVCANELTEDYFDIATNYCVYGKYSDALNYINKILQVEPSNQDAKELKNTLLRIMNPNVESYLTTTDQNLKQAFAYKKAGDRQGFVSKLENKNDFWSNYFLAEYHRENNNPQNAIIYYKKAIELKPNYSQSYLGLGKCYIDTQDYNDAISILTKYLSYNKNSDIAYALRAEANMNMNYLPDAEDDIKKALNTEENISYLLTDAKISYYKGDYDGARIKLNMLSRIVQTSEVYKYIGLCDYAQNDYKNALLNLNKAIILSDDDKSLNTTYNNIKSTLKNGQN